MTMVNTIFEPLLDDLDEEVVSQAYTLSCHELLFSSFFLSKV